MMRWWFGDVIEEDAIDYIRRFSIGVVGSRIMLELLWRIGVGRVKYVGDFITPNDVMRDVSLNLNDANDYDVVTSMGDTDVFSYLYPGDYGEFKRQLKGVDVIVAHKYVRDAAKVAEEFGVPFIPDFITTFLPDGVSYFEVVPPKVRFDPISYTILCSIQAYEVLKILTGFDDPIIAPKALIVEPTARGYVREIELNLRQKL